MKNEGLSRRLFMKIVGTSPLLGFIPDPTSSSPAVPANVSLSALDIYGGKTAVVARMNDITRKELKRWEREGKLPEVFDYFGDCQTVSPERISAFMNGQVDLDYNFFESLGQDKLGIPIYKVLGKPSPQKGEVRAYWVDQMNNKAPMTLMGNSKRLRTQDQDLRFYMDRRAHEELANTC